MRAAAATLCSVLLPLWRARRERRRLQARRDLEVRSAVAIQTAFRAWLARRELLTAVRAAIKIQARPTSIGAGFTAARHTLPTAAVLGSLTGRQYF